MALRLQAMRVEYDPTLLEPWKYTAHFHDTVTLLSRTEETRVPDVMTNAGLKTTFEEIVAPALIEWDLAAPPYDGK